MATKSLTFDIFGRDKTASKTLRGVGNSADRLGDQMRRAGRVMAVGLAVAGAAAVSFGIQSVKAFAEAQVAQERLNFAYAKFPKLADVNRAAFDELNTALMLKTGFDDDALASGQAILAQFGLTGKQVLRLTPLMLDYARANGKDLTTSAEDFGKALLGQGRALKAIGIDFDDAGSTAANFDQLVAGLTTNVGGYAEQFGTTAAGKFEILTQKWGEFQEKVGEALLPGLEKLMTFAESDVMPSLEAFAVWFGTDGVAGIKAGFDWVVKYKDILGPAALALGTLTVAQWALNVAMDANPVGLVILGLAALVVAGTAVAANWGWITSTMADAWMFFTAGVALNINTWLIGPLNGVLGVLNSIIRAWNTMTGMNLAQLSLTPLPVNLQTPAGSTPSGGRSGGKSSVRGRGRFGEFAEGGIVKGGRGGMLGLIGEKSYDEMVIPLKNGGAGFGTQVHIHVNGTVAGSHNDLAKVVVGAMRDAVRSGQIPRGYALA